MVQVIDSRKQLDGHAQLGDKAAREHVRRLGFKSWDAPHVDLESELDRSEQALRAPRAGGKFVRAFGQLAFDRHFSWLFEDDERAAFEESNKALREGAAYEALQTVRRLLRHGLLDDGLALLPPSRPGEPATIEMAPDAQAALVAIRERALFGGVLPWAEHAKDGEHLGWTQKAALREIRWKFSTYISRRVEHDLGGWISWRRAREAVLFADDDSTDGPLEELIAAEDGRELTAAWGKLAPEHRAIVAYFAEHRNEGRDEGRARATRNAANGVIAKCGELLGLTGTPDTVARTVRRRLAEARDAAKRLVSTSTVREREEHAARQKRVASEPVLVEGQTRVARFKWADPQTRELYRGYFGGDVALLCPEAWHRGERKVLSISASVAASGRNRPIGIGFSGSGDSGAGSDSDEIAERWFAPDHRAGSLTGALTFEGSGDDDGDGEPDTASDA